MTTLPQTTPIRLPRVAGQTQLAVPSGTQASSAAPQGPQMTFGDVRRIILQNLWLIALLVGLSAVGGWFLNDYLAKHDARYTTAGLIRIRAVQSADPLHGTPTMDASQLYIAQQTQATIIKSDGLIDDVLMEPDSPIRQTQWYKGLCNNDPQVAKQTLMNELSVEPQPGSEVISVSVTGPMTTDAPVLVNGVVNKAIDNQRADNRAHVAADRKSVADLKETNDSNLRRVARLKNELAEELSREGGDTRNVVNTKEIQLSREVDRQIALQQDKVTVDNAFNAIQSQVQRGEVPAKVQAMVDADRDVVNYKESLNLIDDQVAMMGDQGNSLNPNMVALQKRRELTQNKLTNVQAEKTAEYTKQLVDEVTAERQTKTQLLEVADAEVATLKGAIADLNTKEASYQTLRDEEAGYRDLAKQYESRINNLDGLNREADFGSLVWSVHPLVPTSPSFPKLANVMIGCVGVGLILSLGIAFLRELTDTTVRSDRDIVRMGQMSLLGMVTHESDDPQSSGARLPLVIFEAPQSIMAEELRKVRTRLQHAASLDTTRSILVTSAGPGDGKSTIACNLAAGLALNGRRILLIDANFHRPELHRIFGIGNEVGFSDVLNDVNAFASSVRETTVPNLSVMPSGAKPANSTELLESQLLLDTIERALEEYDHVIFDSGPMLFVSESVALAPRVDGVVTVVRAKSSSRGVLTRMRDGLRAVKAEHLGVVLNGVRTQSGGYYGRSIKTYYEYQNQA